MTHLAYAALAAICALVAYRVGYGVGEARGARAREEWWADRWARHSERCRLGKAGR